MFNRGFVATDLARSSGEHEANWEKNQLGQCFRIRLHQSLGIFRLADDFIGVDDRHADFGGDADGELDVSYNFV